MNRQYAVYIMTNVKNIVLYVGVTNNLTRRVFEHKSSFVPGFTTRYKLIKLVYYEVCESVDSAIAREKQLKGGSRADKMALINDFNREWLDLYRRL
jgi:putative endonuclease